MNLMSPDASIPLDWVQRDQGHSPSWQSARSDYLRTRFSLRFHLSPELILNTCDCVASKKHIFSPHLNLSARVVRLQQVTETVKVGFLPQHRHGLCSQGHQKNHLIPVTAFYQANNQ